MSLGGKRMDKRIALVMGGILSVLVICIAVQASEEEMCVPMGNITIEPPKSVEPKRTPVEFPHAKHFTYECRACHHTWEGDEAIVGCQTSGCHDVAELPKASAGGLADKDNVKLYYKNAYHSNCITCHKDIMLKNQKLERSIMSPPNKLAPNGPVTCSGCHPTE
jgi:hypothetical protein